MSASASGGNGIAQYSAGLRGAVVAHPGGVTLANYLGETFGIVEAKNAQGARITNAQGIRVDRFGYAIIPYLTPYSLNAIELDPKGLPLDIELKSTSLQVAPRANSAVMVRFDTVSGRTAIISAQRPDDTPLPFGASVIDEQHSEVGLVGQGGRIFARGLQDSGKLQVVWGNGAAERCVINYLFPPKLEANAAYARLDARCQSDAGTHNGDTTR